MQRVLLQPLIHLLSDQPDSAAGDGQALVVHPQLGLAPDVMGGRGVAQRSDQGSGNPIQRQVLFHHAGPRMAR